MNKKNKILRGEIPIGAAHTLSDLAIWVEEVNPEIIVIPMGHPLRSIKEFNPNHKYTWKYFRGIKIKYLNQTTK